MGAISDRVGLWIVGACGAVGSTVALGLAALRRGLVPTTGLVTELPLFRSARLIDPREIVIGGHEIRTESLVSAVHALHERSNLFDPKLMDAVLPDLREAQKNVRPGTLCGVGRNVAKLADRDFCPPDASAAKAVERLAVDIDLFRRRHRLAHVVVMHLASSEPLQRSRPGHLTYSRLQTALAKKDGYSLPASSLYALAAIEAGGAFVNFTPSLGVRVPAIRERADQLGLPYMGSDGKTGETLVKSVLAPMFAMRNLAVLSWFGQNILGNRDGAVLSDPKTQESKVRSKDGVVSRIIGPHCVTRVGIDYVPSLDDWKVAWDFIHFEGFLGTRMTLQFIWQGADSILAAPLVIDLTRLAALELQAGRGGPIRHLAFFFKDPLDVGEHDLFTQWQRLLAHVTETGTRSVLPGSALRPRQRRTARRSLPFRNRP